MKKLFYLFLISFLFLFAPASTSAHMIGQPPYFRANGKFTDYYPVPSTSLAEFALPQDIVKEPVLVNQSIEFEIDTNALPVPLEVVKKTKFIWEFGDGSSGQGLKNSHAYSKPGTYFLDIKADSGEGFEPQLLQSTAVNVIPNKDYQLPKAVIEVNGKQSKDPLLDIIEVNFSGKQQFSADKSEAGSSQIVQYSWDLGDQQAAEGKEITYSYTKNPYTVFPLLRVKTADGFIADSFIQIKDGGAFTESKGTIVNPQSNPGINWLFIGGGLLASLILAGIITFIISKNLSKNKSASKK